MCVALSLSRRLLLLPLLLLPLMPTLMPTLMLSLLLDWESLMLMMLPLMLPLLELLTLRRLLLRWELPTSITISSLTPWPRSGAVCSPPAATQTLTDSLKLGQSRP